VRAGTREGEKTGGNSIAEGGRQEKEGREEMGREGDGRGGGMGEREGEGGKETSRPHGHF